MKTKNCLFCGSEFSKPVNESKKNWIERHKFCSSLCKKLSQKGTKKTEEFKDSIRKFDKNKVCLYCGKAYIAKNKNNKYCCHKCSTNASKGVSKTGHAPWNKGLKGFKHSEKSRKKMSESKKGSKSHLWRGGITKLSFAIRNSKNSRDWKIAIFKRDQFKCLDCGDCKGGNLVAHHIKWFSTIMNDNSIKTYDEAMKCAELWDINNGVTVCNKCHEKRHPELKFIGKGGHKNSKAIKLVA